MGDPVSALVQDHYNRLVMDEHSPYSALGKLVMFQNELQNVYDALVTMEENYQRAEDAGTLASAALRDQVSW